MIAANRVGATLQWSPRGFPPRHVVVVRRDAIVGVTHHQNRIRIDADRERRSVFFTALSREWTGSVLESLCKLTHHVADHHESCRACRSDCRHLHVRGPDGDAIGARVASAVTKLSLQRQSPAPQRTGGQSGTCCGGAACM